MGQKARNAGKKKSKICTKIADAKSLKHNIPREHRKKVEITTIENHILGVALFCPPILNDNYKTIAEDLWEKKTGCRKGTELKNNAMYVRC
jgi:hypothetical protein